MNIWLISVVKIRYTERFNMSRTIGIFFFGMLYGFLGYYAGKWKGFFISIILGMLFMLFIILTGCATPVYYNLPLVVKKSWQFTDSTCNYLVYSPCLNYIIVKDAPCDCYQKGDSIKWVQ